MPVRQVLKNLNLFVDGKGQAGQIIDYNPPKLELKVEEFRGGGMDGTIDIEQGMQKMQCDFSLVAYDPDVLALFGLRSGTSVPLVARGALEDHNGNVTAVTHTMRGKVVSMDPGTWKPGEQAPLKTTMTLTYYQLKHGDRVIDEVDLENMIRVVDGVDTLAAQRAALGI